MKIASGTSTTKSIYKNWLSVSDVSFVNKSHTEKSYISAYNSMYLNSWNEVAREARPSLSRVTTHSMLCT